MKKYVQCIDTSNAGTLLTSGKIYKVAREDSKYYYLMGVVDQYFEDRRLLYWYKNRFVVVSPCPCNIKNCLTHRISA